MSRIADDHEPCAFLLNDLLASDDECDAVAILVIHSSRPLPCMPSSQTKRLGYGRGFVMQVQASTRVVARLTNPVSAPVYAFQTGD